jgi:hypothetical protein
MAYKDLIDSLVSSKNVNASGTYQVVGGGTGTYTKTITHEANGIVDKLLVYTDGAGHTATVDTVFTELSDTSVTSVTHATRFDGATSTASRSYALNSDGTIAVDSAITNAKGTSEIVGTITQIKGGCELDGTITTASGATGTIHDQATQSNGTFDILDQIQLTGLPAHSWEVTGTITYA